MNSSASQGSLTRAQTRARRVRRSGGRAVRIAWAGVRRRWYWLAVLAAGVAVSAVPGIAGASNAARAVGQRSDALVGTPQSQTLTYTGSEQSFQVPTGVSHIEVVALGASGGSVGGASAGGAGGYLNATIAVTPGEILDVWPGGAGQQPGQQPGSGGGSGGNDSGSGLAAVGGAGGSGTNAPGGGGGGGASALTTSIGQHVLLVAGGGGGGGASTGGNTGGPGGNGGMPPGNGGNASGLYPGAGGAGGGSSTPAGGSGGSAPPLVGGGGGGGGGGGYLTGGAGGSTTTVGNGGGGGAGSSYVTPSAINVGYSTAASLGNGYITFYWTQPAPVNVSVVATQTDVPVGSPVTLYANVVAPVGDPAPTGNVIFVDQLTGNDLGTATLSPAQPGVAKLTAKGLPHGVNGIYAAYSGDVNYQNESSNLTYVDMTKRMLTASPKALNLGTIAVDDTGGGQVLVTNTGLDPVTINSIGLAAPSSVFSIGGGNCTGATLNPGQRCLIAISYLPTTAGTDTDTLNVADNATPTTLKIPISATYQ